MEKMFRKMEEMMDQMCGEERVGMMKKFMESCFSRMSDEEKRKVFENIGPGMNMKDMPGMNMGGSGGGSDVWNKMPNMLMTMMSVMCMKMMSDMTGPGAASGSPMGGGGGMMGGGGPMKMMQRMMGGMFKNEGDGGAKESCAQDPAASEAGSG